MSKAKNRKVYTAEERRVRAVEALMYRASRLIRWGNKALTSLTRGSTKNEKLAQSLAATLVSVSDVVPSPKDRIADVERLAEFANDLLGTKERTFAVADGCVCECEIKITRKQKPQPPITPLSERDKPQIHNPQDAGKRKVS